MRCHVHASACCRAWPRARRARRTSRQRMTSCQNAAMPSPRSALAPMHGGFQCRRGRSSVSALAICAIARAPRPGRGRLVVDDDVGELDDALLDRLQLVAGVGQLQQHEHVASGERRDADAWTSFSIACRAASSGVWNSGPMSTSKPRSANAVAMTLAPRSWPSCPSLATIIRGRRPSAAAKASTSSLSFVQASSASNCGAVDARHALRRRPVAAPRPPRARRRSRRRWRGRGRARSARSSRLPLPLRAHAVSAASAARTAAPSRAGADLRRRRDLRVAHRRVVDLADRRSGLPSPAGTC